MKHLSHSGLELYRKDKAEFYCKYLAANRPPKLAQTVPMALGSAFDCLVKSEICGRLFKTEVEHNVDEHAADVFKQYKDSGALSSLLKLLSFVGGTPVCEERVTKEFYDPDSSVDFVLQGVPDLWVQGPAVKIVFDWKVNGYYSSAVPKGGYIWCSKSRSEGRGVWLNRANGITVGEKLPWEEQLTGYNWLVGDPGIVTIGIVDQLCFVDQKINVARFAKVLGVGEQLYKEYKDLWSVCHSGHFFRDRDLESSVSLCSQLELRAGVFEKEFDPSGFLKGVFGRG